MVLYGLLVTGWLSNPWPCFPHHPLPCLLFYCQQGLIQIALTFDLYFSHSNSTQTGLDIPPSNTVGSSYRPSLPLCKCNCKVGLLVSWFVTLLCVIILGMLLTIGPYSISLPPIFYSWYRNPFKYSLLLVESLHVNVNFVWKPLEIYYHNLNSDIPYYEALQRNKKEKMLLPKLY